MPYRFSGHESFPCRYAWLPKAYRALLENRRVFTDEGEAMVTLGVGKNMVRSIRFWMQVTGIAMSIPEGFTPTEFGHALLSPTDGLDPYLEDMSTLWLLHWNIATQYEDPVFAWDFLFNSWHLPELSRSAAMQAFHEEADRQQRDLSDATLQQHFDVFLHTYVPTRAKKGILLEDNLDCPLIELDMLRPIGERGGEGERRETVYTFRRGAKPEINPALFLYCLLDFWNKRHAQEQTLTFRQISVGHGSPGQIFKLDEWELRDRLDRLRSDTRGALWYEEKADSQQLLRGEETGYNPLTAIYRREGLNV